MAAEIDEYLAELPDDKRATLATLRAQIRAGAPEATEVIAYGRPGYRLDGRYLVGFGATKSGCAFYTGRAPLQGREAELEGFRLWKGTVNFGPDRPLPPDFVERVVRERVAELRSR